MLDCIIHECSRALSYFKKKVDCLICGERMRDTTEMYESKVGS